MREKNFVSRRQGRLSLRVAIVLIALVVTLMLLPFVAFGHDGVEQAEALAEREHHEPAEEQVVSGTFTVSGLNKYVLNGFVAYGDAVVQGDLFVALPRGWYTDLWFSRGDGRWREDFGDEVDFTIGRTGEIGALAYDAGVAYYAIAGSELGFADVVNPYLTISRQVGKVSPYFTFQHYLPLWGSMPGAGQHYRLGVNTEVTLGERLVLSATPEIFYDSGAFGFGEGFLADLALALSWQVTERLSVGPVAYYYTPLDSADDRESELVWGLHASTSF